VSKDLTKQADALFTHVTVEVVVCEGVVGRAFEEDSWTAGARTEELEEKGDAPTTKSRRKELELGDESEGRPSSMSSNDAYVSCRLNLFLFKLYSSEIEQGREGRGQ